MNFDEIAKRAKLHPTKLLIISETLASKGLNPTEEMLVSVANFVKERIEKNIPGTLEETTIAWIAQQSVGQARQGNSTEIKITTATKAARQKIVASAQPLVADTIDEATSEVLAQIVSGFYGGQGLGMPKTRGLLDAIDKFGQEFSSQGSTDPLEESALMAQLKESFVTGGNPTFLLSGSSNTSTSSQPKEAIAQ